MCKKMLFKPINHSPGHKGNRIGTNCAIQLRASGKLSLKQENNSSTGEKIKVRLIDLGKSWTIGRIVDEFS